MLAAAQKQARFNERPINAAESSKLLSQREIISQRDSSRDVPKQHYSGERPDILSERPTAVTTATIFITLTTVQSHVDYRQGGLQQSQLVHCLSRLLKCSLFSMQIIIKEGYIAS